MPNIAIRDASLRNIGEADPMLLIHGGSGLEHTTLLGVAPLARDYLPPHPHSRPAAMVTGAIRVKWRPTAHVSGFGTRLKDRSVMDRLRRPPCRRWSAPGGTTFASAGVSGHPRGSPPARRLEIVERAGYNPQEEQPGAALDAIRAFLKHERAAVAPERAARGGLAQ